MSSQSAASRRNFVVGMYILTGIILFIAGIIALGSGDSSKDGALVETYIEGSVQGLSLGSPMNLRGVRIGTVEKIEFVGNKYPESPPRQRRFVLVEVRLNKEFSGLVRESRKGASLQEMIDEGMRVRVASQGITGLSYLEVDFVDPQTYVPLKLTWKPDEIYIPSARSQISEIASSVETIARGLADANLPAIAGDLKTVLASLDSAIADAGIAGISKSLDATLDELKQTNDTVQAFLENDETKAIRTEALGAVRDLRESIARIDAEVADASGKADAMLSDVRGSLGTPEELRARVESLDATLANLRDASASIAPTLARLDRSLNRVDALLAESGGDAVSITADLRAVADNVRRMTDLLSRYPALAIAGEPPPHPEVAP